MQKKKEKGITLIALVITLIVLLILAGISIAMLTGDNAILTQASKSTEVNLQAYEKEQIKLSWQSVKIDKLKNGANEEVKATDLKPQLITDNIELKEGESVVQKDDDIIVDLKSGNKYLVEKDGTIIWINTVSYCKKNFNRTDIFSENSILLDDNNNSIKIPKGFKIAADSSTVIEGGVVIQDEKGNQYVWVPVDDFNEFKREHFGTPDQKFWHGGFISDGFTVDDLYEPSWDGVSTVTESDKMFNSVKINNGFYIARYEAGIEGNSPRTENTGIEEEAVSKKDKYAYNYIRWSDSEDTSNENGGAVEIARRIYPESSNSYGATSTLVYGVQWDAIMRLIKDDQNLSGGKCVEASAGMGWYNDNVSRNSNHKTGQDIDNGKNVVRNIYDLAGNMFELTMEANNTKRVTRGGSFKYSGEEDPISRRRTAGQLENYDDVSFRVALYIK